MAWLENSPIKVMEWLEKYGYITTGLSFLLLAILVFFYGWFEFLRDLPSGPQVAVLAFLNELLLVIILLELFRTVTRFLKTRVVSLDPFLQIGIISAVRRILTVGAQTALQVDIPEDRLRLALVDMGANAAIVLALVVSLLLYRLRRLATDNPATAERSI
jgi:uncharacterized membrane protein (DUF373 family)